MKNRLIPWKKRESERGAYPLDLLHRDVNELLDHVFWGSGPFATTGGSRSGVEVSETDDQIRVKAELPGLDEKDIQISMQDNLLTIRGEHQEERHNNKRKYHISEMQYGSYSRTIALPATVDTTLAIAKFKRGILTLDLPKTNQAKNMLKRIQVSSD